MDQHVNAASTLLRASTKSPRYTLPATSGHASRWQQRAEAAAKQEQQDFLAAFSRVDAAMTKKPSVCEACKGGKYGLQVKQLGPGVCCKPGEDGHLPVAKQEEEEEECDCT